MNTIQGQTSSHTSSISQYAAIEAIGGNQDYIDDFVRKRRDLVVERINEAQGLECRTPDGSFDVFVNCHGVIGSTTPQGKVIESDMDFAMYLLEHFGVAVRPGSGFMASPYIRISYAASVEELQHACGRMLVACEALSEGERAYGKAKQLREPMAERGLVHIMAAHSLLSATLAEEAGFDGLWAFGALRSCRYEPDCGRSPVSPRCRSSPMDTGYGDALNVIHAIGENERQGRRCGAHRSAKQPALGCLNSICR
ncbi:aminotransferase class I/II-fold pyridoxal phosphate-dependent enzyme [Phyllobacterium zundukense]|uniref:Aminotransferase class I/II-fold pyridoxal phosphate-dependent enzyme n=1 Tax=Phyllobacterium zundukense TaxID=1867719 RepID=A0ACD4CV71_9HYPH|nr:aminotransferase class I/II-fold pyridoxal phosphate-dependent enzyme [Phyllobacterium zundukense]UXN57488.1 aminotransferase class I/II-fold pyridoxal phosphate-dependent enzyme [Phyllobacterium zundukense]